jgi:hypothetical protein
VRADLQVRSANDYDVQLGLQSSVDFATLLTSITYKNRTLTDAAREILSGFVNVQANVALLVRACCRWWSSSRYA